MARDEEMERRLLNWARWVHAKGGGVNGYSGVDWQSMADGDAGRDGYITATIPIASIEASETHDAVARLPSELRATVESHYLSNDRFDDKLHRLHISKTAYYVRLERAHRQLAEHFMAQLDRRRAERERVESLAHGVRPV